MIFTRAISRIILKKYYKSFISGSRDVASFQEGLLAKIIKKNKTSQFGEKYQFSTCSSINQFREKVPVLEYEDYFPWIEKICSGEKGVLTSEEVLRIHLSSGSSSSNKLIPFTKSLRAEFFAGLAPWLYDLSVQFPEAFYGSQFWLVSPQGRSDKKTSGGLNVGFDQDESYFPYGLSTFFASKGITGTQDVSGDAYYLRIAKELLSNPKLSLISIWNPSFLIIFLERILAEREVLLKYFKERYLSLSSDKLNRRFAEVVLFLEGMKTDSIFNIDWQTLWPKLILVSTWSDSWASHGSKILSELFPSAYVHPKGLMATEGIVTFPLCFDSKDGKKVKHCLSIASHFYEFIDRSTGRLMCANELEKDGVYEVLITTGGGLYRYKLGDLVLCKDFFNSCPVLEFLGKDKLVSDICGEKLNAEHVEQEILSLRSELKLEASRMHLVPVHVIDKTFLKSHYVLVIIKKTEGYPCFHEVDKFREVLDNRLRKNIHYDNCRYLGQLAEIKVLCMSSEEYLMRNEKNILTRNTSKEYVLDYRGALLHLLGDT